MNPILEHEGIVAMAARDDDGERRNVRQRQRGEFFPDINLKRNFAREIMMVGEGRTVVKDGDFEIELSSQGCDGLGDVAGAGDPEIAWRSDGFLVEPIGSRSCRN